MSEVACQLSPELQRETLLSIARSDATDFRMFCPGELVIMRIDDRFAAFDADAELIAERLGLGTELVDPLGDDPIVIVWLRSDSRDRWSDRLSLAGHRIVVADRVAPSGVRPRWGISRHVEPIRYGRSVDAIDDSHGLRLVFAGHSGDRSCVQATGKM